MGEQIDPKLAKQVAKTQELLSPFVKKGLLVEKHLARPPFRQLHDIIMGITDSTGFFKGLFTPEELDSNNIKTKEAKVAFLQKIIDVVGIATGQTMSLKPSKVLAGQEVEKTNEFLQSLGKALKDGVKGSDAVKSVTGKGTGASDAAKVTTKAKSDAVSKKPAATGAGDARSRVKDPSPAKKPAPAPAKASEKNVTTKKDAAGSKPGGQTSTSNAAKPGAKPVQKAKGSTERSNAKPQPVKATVPATQPSKTGAAKSQSNAAGPGSNSRRNSLTNAQQQQPEAKGNISRSHSFTVTKVEDEDINNSNSKNGSATNLGGAGQALGGFDGTVDQSTTRGATSRGRQQTPVTPASDRSSAAVSRTRNSSGVGSTRQMNGASDIPSEPPADTFFTRPASARPGAPRPKTASTNYREDASAFRPPTSKVSNVLVDTTKENADDDDEADRFVVQENPPETLATPAYGIGRSPFGGATESDGINIEELPPEQRGFLVNQILETKKEYEESGPGKFPDAEMSEHERSKLHQNWEAEIDKLKNLLQTIARASNPLGKLMDYVQEDIDTMLAELNQYREENRRLDELYEEEQIKMKKELEPLQKQLDAIDDEIKDAEDALIGSKLEVLRQEEKISKILHGLESVPKGGYGTLDPKKLSQSIKVFDMDVDINSTGGGTGGGSIFRNDMAADFGPFMTRRDSTQQPSYLQVPEPNLDSLVLEEDYS